MLRTAALLGGFTLGSRLLGLARDMGMAWLLGGGAAADALVAAMRLPHVLRRLLGEGSLSMTLTAGLVRRSHGPAGDAAEERGRAHALRPLASALAVRLGLVLVVLTLAGLLSAPWLASALAPGFSGPEAARVTDLLRICLPYLLTAGMAALGMALLHSMGIFWLPALSPALFNLTMLLFTAAAALGGPRPPWLWACSAAGWSNGWRSGWPCAACCRARRCRSRCAQIGLIVLIGLAVRITTSGRKRRVKIRAGLPGAAWRSCPPVCWGPPRRSWPCWRP